MELQKGRPENTDGRLDKEILGLKWFITGHQKKIEIRLLTIAQEQIFADRGVVAKGAVNFFTGFHTAGLGSPLFQTIHIYLQAIGS